MAVAILAMILSCAVDIPQHGPETLTIYRPISIQLEANNKIITNTDIFRLAIQQGADKSGLSGKEVK